MKNSNKRKPMATRSRAVVAVVAAGAIALGGALVPVQLAGADIPPASVEVTVPQGAIELYDQDFRVRLHPGFPQVVDYRLGDGQLAGRLGTPPTTILVNGTARTVSVDDVHVDPWNKHATYPLTISGLAGVSLEIVVSVADATLRMDFNLVDPNGAVETLQLPDLDLVTVGSDDPGAQLTAADIGPDGPVDRFENLADTAAGGPKASSVLLVNHSGLAAGLEANTLTAGADAEGTGRWLRQVRAAGSGKVGTVNPGVWHVADSPEAPYLAVRVANDINGDAEVDWQDAAVAARELVATVTGADDVPYEVVTRVVENRASQATNPFTAVLDETKRVSLATDNLAQRVLFRGHAGQGHGPEPVAGIDDFTPAIGTLADLKVMAEEGERWNTVHGLAVGSAALVQDLDEFWNERPDNVDWLHLELADADRATAGALGEQGWVLSTEDSQHAADATIGNPVAGDEGADSQVLRFIHNSWRDGWATDPILGSAAATSHETGAEGSFESLMTTVWEQNLPAKFLAESGIMNWDTDRIEFANGTVATTSSGTRSITYDDAEVYRAGTYLLPWYDGGTDWNSTGPERLYHYNPDGGSSTWQLTDTWAGQEELKLFRLTDTGRVHVADVRPTNGSVTINAEAGQAYVLYSSQSLPGTREPAWGQGSVIADPGFSAGEWGKWTTAGNISLEHTDDGEREALFGPGEATLGQELQLPSGNWTAWVWVEVEPGQQRDVTLTASGSGVGDASGTHARTAALRASTAVNATFSDKRSGSHFQRLPVYFTSTGAPVTLELAAGQGTAEVRADDFRVLSWSPVTDPAPTGSTIHFHEFAASQVGYWPFVTGSANAGRHASTSLVEQGGDVSLLLSDETAGEVIRTAPGAIPFEAGRRYRVSMSHQTSAADQYQVRLGHDLMDGGKQDSLTTNLGKSTTPAVFVGEFDVTECGFPYIAVDRVGTARDADLSILDIRVEDVGAASGTSCGGTPEPTPTPSASQSAEPSEPSKPSQSPKPSPSRTTSPPTLDYPEKLYRTPGLHRYNGRQWSTTCEPYSQTTRCRTSIWATTIELEAGTYVQRSGWLFNNLTYLPSPRSLWGTNPLGGNGLEGFDERWSSSGRQWRTECDTAATGRGGCRAYIWATVIEPDPTGGFKSENVWLFNNIVLFD